MSYKIEKLTFESMWFATMKITVPDYSRDFYLKAIDSLRRELIRLNVPMIHPEYNFTIAYDREERIEIVDVKLLVAVEKPLEGTELIQFEQLPADDMIRITASSFEDVHIGIAEWMHENDYVADGELRRIVDVDQEYVFDCPYKDSEE